MRDWCLGTHCLSCSWPQFLPDVAALGYCSWIPKEILLHSLCIFIITGHSHTFAPASLNLCSLQQIAVS